MTKRVISGNDEAFLRREGLAATPAVWEDGQRIDTGPGAFEWWYFDAHLDDGSTAVIVFMTKPLLARNGPLAPAVIINITRPDDEPGAGEKLSAFLHHPPAAFSAAQDRCDVRIGENWVQGDLHRYEFHAAGDGLGADLVFTGIVPPWRPGAGKNYYDEELTRYFGWLPAIPHGSVEGTLVYDGETHQVTGVGYHDHNWGNVGLNDVMDHWTWGRAHVGDFTVIFVEMTTAKAYGSQKMPVFLLAQGDRILIGDGAPLTMEAREMQPHPSKKAYPNMLDFHWEAEEGSVHLALRNPRLLESASLLTDFPAWKRWLLRLFANPYYFRFNADLELRVDLPEVQAVESGSALYELMFLR